MMNWTPEQLLGEIAGILVRLEEGRPNDALYMATVIVGGTMYHEAAKSEFAEEISLIEEGLLAAKETSLDIIERLHQEHLDEYECCECGSPEHTCQDCPVFVGEEISLTEENLSEANADPFTQANRRCPECYYVNGKHASDCYHADCDEDDWLVHGCGPTEAAED